MRLGVVGNFFLISFLIGLWDPATGPWLIPHLSSQSITGSGLILKQHFENKEIHVVSQARV